MAESLFDRAEFEPAGAQEPTVPANETAAVRLRRPVRNQIEFGSVALDQLIDPDHPVRLVWELVSRLDLSPWLCDAKAVDGRPGRDTTDPRLLLSLWIYATLQGIGSARELARLCEQHLAYRWLCGGVTVNHRLLSEFRSDGGARLDELHVNLIGSLTASGLVTLNRVAQDGMKTRASAGKSSFRRRSTLERCLDEAREQVETLKRLAAEDAAELTARQRGARQRAAQERLARVEEALRQCEELQAQRDALASKSGREPQEARASTTDPDARTMKMADGGYRPAVNIQFATDVESRIVVGVEVTNDGTDSDQLPPMLDRIAADHGRRPDEALVDGGFATLDTIQEADARGCTVYAPLKDEQRLLAEGRDPYLPKNNDSAAVAAWRTRMGTQAAKEIYRLRAQTAEWINAVCRNRGLTRLLVRGLEKCRSVALLQIITHNLFQGERLRAAAG